MRQSVLVSVMAIEDVMTKGLLEMAVKTLGEALKSAIARGMIDGNGGIGVPSDAVLLKEPADVVGTPAVVEGGIKQREKPLCKTQPAEAASPAKGRCEPTHNHALPQRRVGSHLILVIDNEGDGPAWSEGGRAPGRLRIKPRRDRASELGWLVIEGGVQWTASALCC